MVQRLAITLMNFLYLIRTLHFLKKKGAYISFILLYSFVYINRFISSLQTLEYIASFRDYFDNLNKVGDFIKIISSQSII